MELRKVDHDHWIWGEHHIRYSNSFGNSGWFWDKKNEGVTFGCDTKDDFLEVLDQIVGDRHQPSLMPTPANFRQQATNTEEQICNGCKSMDYWSR